MCEATFRSSTPRSYLNITYPVYAEVNRSIELKANGKGKQELIGTTTAVYFFCEGADHNQITLTDAEDIIRVRERIANDPDYTEISCNDEARMLGCGSNEPVGGRDHSKHIEELKRKYGGDEEHEYSDWDRELISKIRQ